MTMKDKITSVHLLLMDPFNHQHQSVMDSSSIIVHIVDVKNSINVIAGVLLVRGNIFLGLIFVIRLKRSNQQI